MCECVWQIFHKCFSSHFFIFYPYFLYQQQIYVQAEKCISTDGFFHHHAAHSYGTSLSLSHSLETTNYSYFPAPLLPHSATTSSSTYTHMFLQAIYFISLFDFDRLEEKVDVLFLFTSILSFH